MADHEVISLCTVLPELLLELGGGLRLNVADTRPQAIPDAEQPLIGPAVPGLVADRPRREEGDAELAGRARVGCPASGGGPAGNERDAEQDVGRCGETMFTPHVCSCKMLRGKWLQQC